jgi:hypothetical protein
VNRLEPCSILLLSCEIVERVVVTLVLLQEIRQLLRLQVEHIVGWRTIVREYLMLSLSLIMHSGILSLCLIWSLVTGCSVSTYIREGAET